MDYQKEYIQKNPDLHNSDADHKIDSIQKLLNSTSFHFNSIIDVACGSGKVLLEITNRYKAKRVLGIDISRKMIEKAKSKDNKKIIDWSIANVFDLPPNDFELVLAIDILEHVENDLAFLKQIKRLGRFIVVKTPIEKNIMNSFVKLITFGLVDEQKHTEDQYGHIHHYSQKELYYLIERANLKIIFKKYIHLPRRSKWFWEVIRIVTFPVWYISKPLYLKINGGFLLLLMQS